MRDAIWRWARRGLPEGCILPWWLLAIRAALYPLEFLRWRLARSHGWQFESDTYRLYGVTYSGAALRALADADGEVYRITRRGEVVTLERVPNAVVSGARQENDL
jgi:hypothetical protein